MSPAAETVGTVIEAVKLAGRLLPDFIDWVRSMLKIGRSEEEMRRDIKDRRAEIERMWARQEEDLERKHRDEG